MILIIILIIIILIIIILIIIILMILIIILMIIIIILIIIILMIIILVPYPEVVEQHPGAQDVPVQADEVRLQGVDQQAGLVAVDVQPVLLQQHLLLPPPLGPVLRQLLHLTRPRSEVRGQRSEVGRE